jgi:thiol-disulfide isomerase/thioredoxin
MTHHYAPYLLAFTLLAAGLSFTVACSRTPSNASEPTPVLSGPPNTTYPMPPLNMDIARTELGWTLHDGQRVRLADYRGRALALDFYATWCAPCRQSIPHLIDLQRRYGPQGLQVVGLNVGGPDDRVKVPGFAGELQIQYPLGFPDKALTDFFLSDNATIPQTFVFDRQGQLVKRFIGYDEAVPGQLQQAIQTALISSSY